MIEDSKTIPPATVNVKHGHARRGKRTAEFRAWHNMRTRCYNPKAKDFHNYGGRGITVCHRWNEGFRNFLNDMGLKPSSSHSLERRDNGGNYEPGNCRWATKEDQSNNRRTTVLITHDGKTMTQKEWAKHSGIGEETLRGRIKYGWPFEVAISTPATHTNRRKRLIPDFS